MNVTFCMFVGDFGFLAVGWSFAAAASEHHYGCPLVLLIIADLMSSGADELVESLRIP